MRAPLTSARIPPVDALKRAGPGFLDLLRLNWLFACIFAAGAALRIVTFFAYRPVIFGVGDSFWYLDKARHLEPDGLRPIGYSAFLRLLPLGHDLSVVPLVQHVLGLLLGVLLYALLGRLGVRRWVAALASAPVLLDSYQLNIEQQILSETVFEVLLVAACALLLWRRPLGLVPAALAGLLLGAAVIVRTVGLFVIVPAALAVLFLRARVSRPVTLAVLLVSFAVPAGSYAVWFHSAHDVYGFSLLGGRYLYGRVSQFADCTKFTVPKREQALCLDQPPGRRPAATGLVWGKKSPINDVVPPPGKTKNDLASDFAKRAIRNQPLAYARAVGREFLWSYSPTKTTKPGGFRIPPWQFQPDFPIFTSGVHCGPARAVPVKLERGCARRSRLAIGAIRSHGGTRGSVDPQLVSVLRTYQRFAYTPGPLLGLGILLAAAAALGLGRARRSGLRTAAFLFAAVAVTVNLVSVLVTNFSWRYQLPQLALAPPAGALALAAFWRRARADPRETAAPSDAAGGHAPR